MKALPLSLLIFVFCISLFSFGAQSLSLKFKGDENFYFESAKEMLETGDILTPRYMGKERFQKPAFFYWLILLSFKIFGAGWFAARLPSIIFGALCVLLVFGISNLLFRDKKIGLFAALFLATTPLCYRYARLAVPDMALVFFITLALYCFVRFYKYREDRRSAVLFFVAMALAVLVKGPVGLIIPLLIAGIFCLIKREKKLFSGGILFTGILIFALIVAPWFYFMYKAHGGTYISYVWSREILQRLSCGDGYFITRYFKGFLFYASALITRFLPYSFFMPLAFISSIRVLSPRSSDKRGEEERSAYIFLILWVAVVFLFFAFVAERRAHYLLALAPAASILIGAVFKKAISDNRFFSKIGFRIPYLAALTGLISFAILFIFSDYITGKGEPSVWKYTLVIIPLILILGSRLKNSGFMPLSLVSSLAFIYIATTISPPFGLFTNKMERAASAIKSELKKGDRVGIGSHGIIPEELQVYFELPVENVKVMYERDGAPSLKSAGALLQFLRSSDRIFCVIKRKDYTTFISQDMKKDLYILDRYYVWKRRIRFDRELKQSLSNIRSSSFREIFQNEIYVISNRK